MTSTDNPELSVIIPTYNRSDLLEASLRALNDQRFPKDRFEVIVADDGSSDDTHDIVRTYRDKLRMQYWFQEDLGGRVATARNHGARFASAPVLGFLDTGVLPGPDWVRSHVEAHNSGQPRKAVVGYVYGYSAYSRRTELANQIGTVPLEEIVAQLSEATYFQDMRDPDFARVDDDLRRLVMPWVFFFTLNVSLRADDFWIVGGFDERFRGWGVEDIELGYRIHQHGLPMSLSRQAWAIEAPHERPVQANSKDMIRNCVHFTAKHGGLQPELYYAVSVRGLVKPLEEEWRDLSKWILAMRGVAVPGELEAETNGAAPVMPTSYRIAVFGCGSTLPSSWETAGFHVTLCDFDSKALEEIGASHAGKRHMTLCACGMRTPFPDDSFDLVIITSRLAPLWERWGELVMREARRIGRNVRTPLLERRPV